MILVTGASGFIGSNVVQALNRRGRNDVVAVDVYSNLPQGQGPCHVSFGVRYADCMTAALCIDAQSLLGWLERAGDAVEAVLHLGACSDTMATDRQYVMSNNLQYTQALWNWCVRANRPMVYASSAATYGDGRDGYSDEVDPNRFQPLNLYAESKHLFDLWALQQLKAPPRWAGVKYFNVYGPHEEHKGRMASVVLHAFEQWLETGRVRLFESHRPDVPHGGQQRDFIYVADAVDATLHLLQTPATDAAPNGLYNIGTGEARTFYDLITALFAAVEGEPRIEFIPMPQELRDKYQYFTQAQVAKLRRSGFGWPFQSIEQGVHQYVRQYLQPHWGRMTAGRQRAAS